jgi:hypothetical protein
MTDTDLKDDVTIRSLSNIVPYGENPKEHPQEQVDKIASSIQRFGWDQPIVVDNDGTIIKGHGRYQAALKLGLNEVPVIEQTGLTEAQARAARIADNRVAESDWDDDLLAVEMQLLGESDIAVDAAGFDDGELLDIDEDLAPPELERDNTDVEYTEKIKTPTYEPTQDDPPSLADCYDTERYEELMSLIDAAEINPDLLEFFQLAAQRHIVFDYENIAEYYAHADPDVQEVMEALTLIIVDYDQAIEQGFVDFANKVTEAHEDA